MPKLIVPLSDMKIRRARPKSAQYSLFDGEGLYLLVMPYGRKLWRFKYRFEDKERLLSFGKYPEVSLDDAREKRLEARKAITSGADPGAARKAKKAEETKAKETVESIALEWFRKFRPTWTPGHAKTILSRLRRDVFPWIGSRPINEIKAPEVLALLRRVESRGALESAHRIRSIINQVMRYAVVTGRAEQNPVGDLKGAISQPGERHLAAITEPKEAAELLRAIDGYQGHHVTRCALRLAPLVFVRPGELRHAEWVEVDFGEAVWKIPGHKMKGGAPHIVPLSRQALEILGDVKALTGGGRYVFPSLRSASRPMSENAILGALRRLGYAKDTMTGHGFRAMARTLLDEVLQFRVDLIEHQLAHAVKDPLGRAYNRTHHLAERRKMMQAWADYMDGLKAGAKVIPLIRAASD